MKLFNDLGSKDVIFSEGDEIEAISMLNEIKRAYEDFNSDYYSIRVDYLNQVLTLTLKKGVNQDETLTTKFNATLAGLGVFNSLSIALVNITIVPFLFGWYGYGKSEKVQWRTAEKILVKTCNVKGVNNNG